jgi:hypothetical protein
MGCLIVSGLWICRGSDAAIAGKPAPTMGNDDLVGAGLPAIGVAAV